MDFAPSEIWSSGAGALNRRLACLSSPGQREPTHWPNGSHHGRTQRGLLKGNLMTIAQTNSTTTSAGDGETTAQPEAGTYAALMAKRDEIDAKLQEIETVTVPAMRERWEREAAQIGKTVKEVLGIADKKPRGRKHSKREE